MIVQELLIENEKLRAELKIVIAELRVMYTELEKVTEENKLLRQEVNTLKDKLGVTSKNSSLPPSRDLYKAKKFKRSSGKKPGGQPGHKGHSREKMEADENIECKIAEQCICGGEIKVRSAESIQKIELPVIKPIVTNYVLNKGSCIKCRKEYQAVLPEGVTADLLGNNAKTIIAALTGFFNNSKRDVQSILKNIFNVDISLGLISKTEERVSIKCESKYNDMCSKLEDSKYLHIDETGHKNRGKRYWTWLTANDDTSVIKINKSRGMCVLEKMLPEYEGTVISDRYAAYNYFKSEQRQICWAHLMRDFERFASSSNKQVREIGEVLKSYGNEMFALRKSENEGLVDRMLVLRRIKKIRRNMYHYLKRTIDIPDAIQAARVAKNILKCESMMWKFLESPDIEPTNNFAERQIRKYVTYRKNSLFTWSDRGDRFIERLLSIWLTAKSQSENPFNQLANLVSA